ncbi:Retrovirus-related Pol polyprotein LINE-1 [Gossypium australe]|uniref:Retrovirus-related Pol polyprotein LINE-1 n=1 Tax=Gossypium australe TaxID=47621 RepID=A0A5B6X1L4_9ROSI|nr:Retrovirus-related Pol polyprotein LINE-1 [Gossypium australe]
MYKLVMKVIANRFKFVFPNIISQEQAGFIAGWNISDNIILAQEVIHSMRCKRNGKNWMAIKLDLEKAYDRVSWDFIRASLEVVGVPEFLRKRNPSGVSLSPYLFVLCMDWLGHLIRSEIDTGRRKPIQLSRSGLAISHLFFADDLVIFCKAHCDQACLLKNILDQFCEVSGHKISTRKSNIYFSKGVPLLHSRVTKSTFSFVVDKVRCKLNSWDVRKLSIAGRVTLAQSVLLSIPNYFMQSMLIPKGVCAEIERLVRQFI